MIWGCMGWNEVGKLAEVEGRMDGEQYVAILNDHLLPSMEKSGIAEGDTIFQQDNDPKHTSKKAIEWLDNEDITVLEWPTQSPDLNPIEDIWENLKKKLSAYDKPPPGLWELWSKVEIE